MRNTDVLRMEASEPNRLAHSLPQADFTCCSLAACSQDVRSTSHDLNISALSKAESGISASQCSISNEGRHVTERRNMKQLFSYK